MTEGFEYKGIWWLPDNPEEQIHGTFKFATNEGAILELTGSFNVPRTSGEMQHFPIILGITVDGKEITLTNCLETENATRLPALYSPLA